MILNQGTFCFDQFLRHISSNASIERLEFKKLPDMVNFKFQNILYLELKNFSKLKLIEIDLDALILTRTFFENVSELTSLSELKLNLNKFDIEIFKAWSLTGLTKVRRLKLYNFKV